MLVRPGAEELVASLLQEPRCEFAFVSGMGEKYCLPIAGRLLQRVAPDGEWVLDRHGAAPCWVSTGHPRARVYVLGQPRGAEGETQGGEYVVKDLNRVWAALHECGCGWDTEHNIVLLDTVRHSASRPESVWVVRRWRPLAEGAEDPNPVDPELGRQLLAFLEEGASVAQHIGLERATVWGPYQWVTDLEEARSYMEQLWVDLMARPILGVEVECHYPDVCVVPLASWRRWSTAAAGDRLRGPPTTATATPRRRSSWRARAAAVGTGARGCATFSAARTVVITAAAAAAAAAASWAARC